jgi:hypothetical protein
VIGSPSTSIDLAIVGICSPMIERISTDLPVPDPPTTPRISPRRTVEVEPFVNHLLAEALRRPSTTMGPEWRHGVFRGRCSAALIPTPLR